MKRKFRQIYMPKINGATASGMLEEQEKHQCGQRRSLIGVSMKMKNITLKHFSAFNLILFCF